MTISANQIQSQRGQVSPQLALFAKGVFIVLLVLLCPNLPGYLSIHLSIDHVGIVS